MALTVCTGMKLNAPATGGNPNAVSKVRKALLLGAKTVRFGPMARFNTESSLLSPVCPESALVMAARRNVSAVSALINADRV